MNLKLSIFILCVVVGLYGLLFIKKARGVGIDPALLTHINPLGAFHHAPLIWSYVLVLVFGSVSRLIFSIGATAMCLCFVHITLLLSFGRSQTQPFWAYCWAFLGFVFALTENSYSIFFAALCLLCLLFFFIRWPSRRVDVYNAWVRSKTISIHKKYWLTAVKESSELDWYCTLLIATTESIARPKLSRMIEYAYFFIKKPAVMSSGIMQVASTTYLSDTQSIQKGHKMIHTIMAKMPHTYTKDEDKMAYLAKEYNGSYGYQQYLYAVHPGFQSAWHQLKQDDLFS